MAFYKVMKWKKIISKKWTYDTSYLALIPGKIAWVLVDLCGIVFRTLDAMAFNELLSASDKLWRPGWQVADTVRHRTNNYVDKLGFESILNSYQITNSSFFWRRFYTENVKLSLKYSRVGEILEEIKLELLYKLKKNTQALLYKLKKKTKLLNEFKK